MPAKWQMGFNLAFKGLIILFDGKRICSLERKFQWPDNQVQVICSCRIWIEGSRSTYWKPRWKATSRIYVPASLFCRISIKAIYGIYRFKTVMSGALKRCKTNLRFHASVCLTNIRHLWSLCYSLSNCFNRSTNYFITSWQLHCSMLNAIMWRQKKKKIRGHFLSSMAPWSPNIWNTEAKSSLSLSLSLSPSHSHTQCDHHEPAHIHVHKSYTNIHKHRANEASLVP